MDLKDIFANDQDYEPVKRFGAMFGAYYTGLVQAGVPEDVAKQMTLDYHWITTCKSSFGDKRTTFPPRS